MISNVTETGRTLTKRGAMCKERSAEVDLVLAVAATSPKLRAARDGRPMQYKEIGRLCGVSGQAIYNMEQRALAKALSLLRARGVTCEDIF